MHTKRFEVLETHAFGVFKGGGQILKDKETGVLYLFYQHGYGGGLTVMVDADGKPLTDNSIEPDLS